MWPRNPGPFADNYPTSAPIYAPQLTPPDEVEPTQWTAYGMLDPAVFRGGYDELSLRSPAHSLMAVAQADTYDSSTEAWPHIGTAGPVEGLLVMHLPPHTSAHPGFAETTKRGDPSALFQSPPPLTAQSTPIPALGL